MNRREEVANPSPMDLMAYFFQHGEQFDQKAALADIDNNINGLNEEISNLKKKHKGILSEGKVEDVLSAEEIMQLPSEERAFMLNKEHEDLFSQQQLNVINRLRELGQKEDIDFLKHINDHANMTRLQESNGRIFSKNVADQEWLSRMIGKAKMYGSMKNGNDMAASLESVKNYEDFVKLYNGYIEGKDSIAIQSMNERLSRDKFEHFKRMNDSRTSAKKFEKASETNSITNLNGITAEHIYYAVEAVKMMAETEGIDIATEEADAKKAAEIIDKLKKRDNSSIPTGDIVSLISDIKRVMLENRR